MTREWRGAIRRRDAPADDRTGQALATFDAAHTEHVRPEGETWADATPEAVRAALERSRLIPLAILDPCPTGHASAGARCYDRGVCGARLRHAVEARALAFT
jgi:hypothetical protein